MGRMPKRKSRRIVVDGRTFRWRLTGFGKPWDDEWMFVPPRSRSGRIALQEETERPGRVCQFFVHGREGDSVTPSVMEKLVRRALGAGWDPAERGIPFQVDSVDLKDYPSKMSIVREVMES